MKNRSIFSFFNFFLFSLNEKPVFVSFSEKIKFYLTACANTHLLNLSFFHLNSTFKCKLWLIGGIYKNIAILYPSVESIYLKL